MARIRTVKPKFFRHRQLFLAEQESGMPLRIAFAGLWTCADREGRFAWDPDELKLDCLPYDDVDFSRVLDALASRGFLVRYASGNRLYGVIPGFKRHQFVNNREADSELPEPPDNIEQVTEEPKEADASTTRHDLAQAEQEGKGTGREGKGTDSPSREVTRRVREQAFDIFWGKYPYRDGSNPRAPAERAFNDALNAGAGASEIMIGLDRFIAREEKNIGTRFIPQAVTWLSEKRWIGDEPAQASASSEKLDIDVALKTFLKTGHWSKHAPCGEPGSLGFSAPPEILAKYGLGPDGLKAGALN